MDSNSHHVLWDSLTVSRHCNEDDELHDLVLLYPLALVSPPDVPTHIPSNNVIDLGFASTTLLHNLHNVEVDHSLGLASDHWPIVYQLDLSCDRITLNWFNQSKMNLERFLDVLQHELDTPIPPINNQRDLDGLAELLNRSRSIRPGGERQDTRVSVVWSGGGGDKDGTETEVGRADGAGVRQGEEQTEREDEGGNKPNTQQLVGNSGDRANISGRDAGLAVWDNKVGWERGRGEARQKLVEGRRVAVVTDEEVDRAVWKGDGWKAPDVDGVQLGFMRMGWEVLGPWLLERLVADRMVFHVESRGLMCKEQFWGRPERSTQQAVHALFTAPGRRWTTG
ncbi:hypothetical protein B0H16DRAFT_1453417 [Mycena metata]|uniref:Endonuclease/exonuclease/phosphatase domain-containing protein n=1 Tax=Mycena metata TaxID=1033252 RepID=A0AAD7JPP6_9AGAR|nr:hypothetical protein B0H16DRAFT_1453417 [Mycena metata]